LIRQNIEVITILKRTVKALTILTKGIDSLGFIIADRNLLMKRILIFSSKESSWVESNNFLSNGKAKEIIDLIIIM